VGTSKQQVRAACYCRISSDPLDKREGVDRQRDDTAALCELKGWQIADVYIDNDRSASNGKTRPEWERLLGDIREGKIDAVAAWDQDRINRMTEEFIAYKGLFVERGVLLATSNNGDIDLSTPAGVLTATIKTAVSEHEVAMMRIRMRRAARQRAERGFPKWKAAFGYQPDTRPAALDDGTRKKDPTTAKLVRDAYKAVLRGATVTEIAAQWNVNSKAKPVSGKDWSPSLVSQLLRSPRNAALRTHVHNCGTLGHGTKPCDQQGKTEVVGTGTWPALVDEATWRAVQTVLDGRPGASQRQPYRRHLLTGVLRCGNPRVRVMVRGTDGKVVRGPDGKVIYVEGGECEGGYLSGMRTLDGDVVYACKTCRGCSVAARHVEPLVFGVVAGRLMMDDAADLLKKSDVHDSAHAEKLRTERATLTARLDAVADERADGLIDGRGYARMTARIQEQIAEIDRQQQDQRMTHLFDGIPLGTKEVEDKLKGLSRDRLRAVMEALVTITVAPVGRGHRVNGERFDRDRVQFDWHETRSA